MLAPAVWIKLALAKAEFQKLELAGIIRRSDSPRASPLHMVQKSDKSWRPCGDYHRLNNVTRPDRYPLPNILHFTFYKQFKRLQVLLQTGPSEGLQSGSHE